MTVREIVYRALDNALDNAPGFVLTASPTTVALDLLAYDADLQEEGPDLVEVENLVLEWRHADGLSVEMP